MLSKCANPACSTPFQYYRDGKLFRIEVTEAPGAEDVKTFKRTEHFWLCGECAAVMTLGLDRGKSVVTIPLKKAVAGMVGDTPKAAAAAAS